MAVHLALREAATISRAMLIAQTVVQHGIFFFAGLLLTGACLPLPAHAFRLWAKLLVKPQPPSVKCQQPSVKHRWPVLTSQPPFGHRLLNISQCALAFRSLLQGRRS